MRRKGRLLSVLLGGLLLGTAFAASGTAQAATRSAQELNAATVSSSSQQGWVTQVTVLHRLTASGMETVEQVSLVPAGSSQPGTVQPAAPISGGATYSCQIQAGISHTSNWSSITGHAQTYNCVGAAACHQTADLWAYQVHLTGGTWSVLRDGPTTSGCTAAHASVVSVACHPTAYPWLYRATGIFHVTWVNGRTSSATLTTGIISGFHLC